MFKKTVLPITLTFSLALSSVSVFGAEWYDSSVKSLTERKIITGTEKVDETITRGELASLLVKAKGLKTASIANPFSDLSSDHKYYNDILTLYSNSIYFGSQDNGVLTAQADESLTRQDAAAYFLRTFGFKSSGATLKFTDSASISDYARDPIATLVDLKIISGHANGTFGPKETLTRSQAYVLLENSILVSIGDFPEPLTPAVRDTSSNNRPGNSSSGGGSNNGSGTGTGSSTVTEAELKVETQKVVGRITAKFANLTASNVVLLLNGDYEITLDDIDVDSKIESLAVGDPFLKDYVKITKTGDTYKIVLTIPANIASDILGGMTLILDFPLIAKNSSVSTSTSEKTTLTILGQAGDKTFDIISALESSGVQFDPGILTLESPGHSQDYMLDATFSLDIKGDGANLLVPIGETVTLTLEDSFYFTGTATTELNSTTDADTLATFIADLRTSSGFKVSDFFNVVSGSEVAGSPSLTVTLTQRTDNNAIFVLPAPTIVSSGTVISNTCSGTPNTISSAGAATKTNVTIGNPAPAAVKGKFRISILIESSYNDETIDITLEGITAGKTKEDIASDLRDALDLEISLAAPSSTLSKLTTSYTPGEDNFAIELFAASLVLATDLDKITVELVEIPTV